MRPTRWPSFDRAMARFTATVVLPTPPLPEPMAMILETPGNATGEGMACECAIVSGYSLEFPWFGDPLALAIVPGEPGKAVYRKFYRSGLMPCGI